MNAFKLYRFQLANVLITARIANVETTDPSEDETARFVMREAAHELAIFFDKGTIPFDQPPRGRGRRPAMTVETLVAFVGIKPLRRCEIIRAAEAQGFATRTINRRFADAIEQCLVVRQGRGYCRASPVPTVLAA
jgi:hypothetical protein